MTGWLVAALVVVLWVLAEAKTSRPDGTLVRIPTFRRMLLAVSPQKKDAVVYFDAAVDATKLLAWLPNARETLDANVTHAVVGAANIGLACSPRMNRFVVGQRIYHRGARFVTFSMKRTVLGPGGEVQNAKLATPKLEMRDGESFADLCARINGSVSEQRSGKETATDKEYKLFDMLPRPVLSMAAKLLPLLDHYNLLPAFFIHDEALYTSMFVANLGSLQMGPGFHHLYEFGNCPIFLMVGKLEERVVAVDGVPEVRTILPLRYTYDERIEDGMNAKFGMEAMVRVLEDPERWLGGADGVGVVWPQPDWRSEDGHYDVRP